MFDVLKLIDYQKQVNGIVLSIVEDEIGDDSIYQIHKLIIWLAVFKPKLILFSYVTSKVADVLVAPTCEVAKSSFQKIEKTSSGSLLSKDH